MEKVGRRQNEEEEILFGFFFQGKGGIRSPLWARGLGDVVKGPLDEGARQGGVLGGIPNCKRIPPGGGGGRSLFNI